MSGIATVTKGGRVLRTVNCVLTLTDIKENDKTFLLDAPISNDGLFGDSVTTVVEKFRVVKQQSAAFRQLIPRRSRETECQPLLVRSRSSSSQRPREVQRREPSPMTPPHKDWGPRSHPWQHKWIDLSSTAKASCSQAPSRSS